jgi:type IV secretion system protein VirB11
MTSSAAKPATQRDQVVQQLLRPLSPYLDRPDVTEVTINYPGFLFARTFHAWEEHEVPELNMGYLESLTTAIAVFNGKNPSAINSVVLPGGERGQIVRAPGMIDGTLSLSIRKHSTVAKSLEQLDSEGAFSNPKLLDKSFNVPTVEEADKEAARRDFGRLEPFELELLALKREGRWREFLHACILHKRNVVIAGKTNSGKTTFARSLIEKVPSHERIITIEDVHELFLPDHRNKVHLLYGEGVGRVSADSCLAACMRMSPDRIFLAELRGNEAWEYVNSLNTGHPGSITTVHANGALGTFERIATLIKKSEVGQRLDLDMVNLLLYRTINVALYFQDRQLVEVFYDPIFANSKIGG